MRIKITFTWPSGGDYTGEIDDEEMEVASRLSDQEVEDCRNGGTISESKPNPDQLDLGKYLFLFAGDIARAQAAVYREGG